MTLATAKHEPRQHDDGVACSCGKEWGHPLVEIEAVGLWRTDDHRYFWREPGQPLVGPLTSVTTAMNILAKPALVPWAIGLTAVAAVEQRATWLPLVEGMGKEAAIAALKTVAHKVRDDAAKRGTAVHINAEQIVYQQAPQVDETTAPYVTQFRRFIDAYRPEFLRVEAMVCNLTAGYAGTLDWIARIDGRVILADNKTSRDIYSDSALQLSALGNAEFLGWPGDPRRHPLPPIDGYAVLHLTPTSFRLVEYKVTPATFRAFRAALFLHAWSNGEAKSVIGAPIPVLEAVA